VKCPVLVVDTFSIVERSVEVRTLRKYFEAPFQQRLLLRAFVSTGAWMKWMKLSGWATGSMGSAWDPNFMGAFSLYCSSTGETYVLKNSAIRNISISPTSSLDPFIYDEREDTTELEIECDDITNTTDVAIELKMWPPV
jgi:hypothetical protein